MRLGKYFAIASISARHVLLQRTALLARMIFFTMILFVFSRLWKVVLADGTSADNSRNMLWYLALTEWVLLSIPTVYLDMEKDIRTGDIVYRLPRPMPYLAAQIAEGLGALLIRAIVLGATGFCAAWIVAGGLPERPLALVAAIPVGIVSAAFGMISYCAIGMLAVWLQDVTPVFWVWQKLAFVFGGLLFPLHVYPEWLRTAAEYTPFYSLLYSTGRLAIDISPAILLETAVRLAIWIGISLLALIAIYRKGMRDLNVNGG